MKVWFLISVVVSVNILLTIMQVKHIDGELWELRPMNDRIFFFSVDGDTFILLHCFKKKTQKTPRKELEQAKQNMKDYKRRISE